MVAITHSLAHSFAHSSDIGCSVLGSVPSRNSQFSGGADEEANVTAACCDRGRTGKALS